MEIMGPYLRKFKSWLWEISPGYHCLRKLEGLSSDPSTFRDYSDCCINCDAHCLSFQKL